MSLTPVEIFIFFILPFIAARACRWAYLDAPKILQYVFFGGLGILALWLWWDSPNAAVRSGVLTMYAIFGIPTLLIAWMWPGLVSLVFFPFRMLRKLFPQAQGHAEGGADEKTPRG
jgi:hypothetical protein